MEVEWVVRGRERGREKEEGGREVRREWRPIVNSSCHAPRGGEGGGRQVEGTDGEGEGKMGARMAGGEQAARVGGKMDGGCGRGRGLQADGRAPAIQQLGSERLVGR